MGQLTIEHLSCYLPYGLNMQYLVRDKVEKEGIMTKIIHNPNETHPTKISIEYSDSEHIWMFKPYLRPLSYLTQEIEHNGERVVPIVELAKIAESDNWLDSEVRYAATETTHAVGWTKDDTRHVFTYSTAHNGFYLECNPYRQIIIANQHKLFQKLAEWHLDFQGLIEQGLALLTQ